jgi:hypothetical protein
MRRVVNHLWPVLHCQPPRSPFRLCDWTAPLCHGVATVIGKSNRPRPRGSWGDPMIRALTDMPSHSPADGSSPMTGYRSVYPLFLHACLQPEGGGVVMIRVCAQHANGGRLLV